MVAFCYRFGVLTVADGAGVGSYAVGCAGRLLRNDAVEPAVRRLGMSRVVGADPRMLLHRAVERPCAEIVTESGKILSLGIGVVVAAEAATCRIDCLSVSCAGRRCRRGSYGDVCVFGVSATAVHAGERRGSAKVIVPVEYGVTVAVTRCGNALRLGIIARVIFRRRGIRASADLRSRIRAVRVLRDCPAAEVVTALLDRFASYYRSADSADKILVAVGCAGRP